MSEKVLLFIVTDDRARASLEVLGFFLTELPDFIRIVTEAREIAAIPSGAKCVGYWFSWNNQRLTEAQLAWQEARDVEGKTFVGIGDAFFHYMDEWNAKRREAERERLAVILRELSAGSDGGRAPAPVQTPRKQRWL